VILVRTDRLGIVAHEGVPFLDGSNRVALLATVRSWREKTTFAAACVHLEWSEDGHSQAMELRYVLGLLDSRGYGRRAIVAGDFNLDLGASPLNAEVAAAGFRIATAPDRTATFVADGRAERLDDILVRGLDVMRAAPVPVVPVDPGLPSETVPSDHLPVSAEIALPMGAARALQATPAADAARANGPTETKPKSSAGKMVAGLVAAGVGALFVGHHAGDDGAAKAAAENCARSFLAQTGPCRKAFQTGVRKARQIAPAGHDLEQLAIDALAATCSEPRENPRPYFVKVAINMALAARHRSPPGETCELDDTIESPPWDPVRQYSDRRCAELIGRLLCSLDDSKAVIVRLRADRHSFAEIAESVGSTPEAVRKTFDRTCDALLDEIPSSCQ